MIQDAASVAQPLGSAHSGPRGSAAIIIIPHTASPHPAGWSPCMYVSAARIRAPACVRTSHRYAHVDASTRGSHRTDWTNPTTAGCKDHRGLPATCDPRGLRRPGPVQTRAGFPNTTAPNCKTNQRRPKAGSVLSRFLRIVQTSGG